MLHFLENESNNQNKLKKTFCQLHMLFLFNQRPFFVWITTQHTIKCSLCTVFSQIRQIREDTDASQVKMYEVLNIEDRGRFC